MENSPRSNTPDAAPGVSPEQPCDALSDWFRILTATICSIYFYFFMEWLFFLTKPSFMSCLSFRQSLAILVTAPLPYLIPVLGLMLLLLLPRLLRIRGLDAALRGLARLLPALVLAAMILILIDNFTYTLFKIGIQTSVGWTRLIHGALYLILVAVFYRRLWMRQRSGAEPPRTGRRRVRVALLVAPLLLSVACAIATRLGGGNPDESGPAAAQTTGERPNIILFCIDGANASHLSLYGYSRDTTPFLRSLASTSLICDNAYTNAGDSGSSDATLLTGKMATTTRLIYPPDILRGRDAYQHLPGILRVMGYHSIDVSIRHYVDPYDLNMINSFDEANERRLEKGHKTNFLNLPLSEDADYFVQAVQDRLQDRLLHAFMLKKMENAYNEAVKTFLYHADDERMAEVRKFIAGTPGPFFAHIHLIGTHGPRFNPQKRVFSAGQVQNQDWMLDFYDDALAESDAMLKGLVEQLKAGNQYADTLLVVYTDHGQGYVTDQRLPLLLHFPGDAHAGHLKENVQTLDVSPTVLDYLNIPQPDWMEGQTLIGDKLDPNRRLLSINRRDDIAVQDETSHLWKVDEHKVGPPFYHLGFLNAVVGDRYFRLDLGEKKLLTKRLPGRAPAATPAGIPAAEVIGRELVEHMKDQKYDMTGFNLPLPLENLDPPVKETPVPTLPATLPPTPAPKSGKNLILDWGPRQTQQGQGFQKLPDGSSAMWFKVAAGSNMTQVIFKGVSLKVVVSEKLVTCTVPPELYAQPGVAPIYLVNAATGQKSETVMFTVQQAPGK